MNNQILQTLRTYVEPLTGMPLSTVETSVAGNHVEVCITLGFPAQQYQQVVRDTLLAHLAAQHPDIQFTLQISSEIAPKVVFSQIERHPQIKNIIALASGKGGVGKSTTTVNLAAALAREGARVGVLDADIYGPSQPQMLGAHAKPTVYEDKRFDPVVCHGMQTMSLGYLVDINTPMVWRGPMVSGALQQLFFDTNWSELDYLFIDLPPGTGDIQLTLSKKVPVTAAVVVTTPQDVALLDARKAVEMFKKVSVPVFGLIENMALHTCSQCGHQEPIFGAGGVQTMSGEIDVPVLGSLPLDIRIREQADRGVPIVIAEPASPSAQAYVGIARTLSARLSLQASVANSPCA